MKVRIDGKDREFETIEDLEEAIDSIVADAREDGYDAGVDAGREDGFDDGWEKARVEYETPDADRRETDLRTDLYRAIHNGGVDRAREVMSLMAMVDVDRDLIWSVK